MKLVAIAALTLLALPTAQAAGWVSLGKPDDGEFEFFIDRTSVRVAGPIRRAWFKTVYPPQTRRGIDDNADKWQSDTVTREAFNCDQEMSRLEALTNYYEDGTVQPVPFDEPFAWTHVAPETVAEYMMKFICSLPAPKPKPTPPAAPKSKPQPKEQTTASAPVKT